MTAAAAGTVDRFEARTHDVLAGVTRVRRALRDHGRLMLTEAWGYFLLRRLLAAVNNDWLAALRTEQAAEAARHLEELRHLMRQVLGIAETKGVIRQWPHRIYFTQFVAVHDRIDDVLESLHLALNEDFRRLVGACADGLKDRPGRRDWRSSLAAMRD